MRETLIIEAEHPGFDLLLHLPENHVKPSVAEERSDITALPRLHSIHFIGEKKMEGFLIHIGIPPLALPSLSSSITERGIENALSLERGGKN